MLKINIRTYDKIISKSFDNKDKLFDFTKLNLTMLIGNDITNFINRADALTNKIWDTNVGQSIKTEMGHIISVRGKSPYHNTEHGKLMYRS